MTFTVRAHLAGVFAAAAFASTPSVSDAQWLELKRAHYSIFYEAGYEKDAEFTRTWLDRTEALMKSKYGVTPDRYRMSLHLHSTPNDKANVSRAQFSCCTEGGGGLRLGTIDYLSPSARAWSEGTLVSSLGMSKNDPSYHAKVILSEYIPIGHYAAQDARPAGSWRYYSAPGWFYQGLQEYDAIFHTTDSNRTMIVARLFDWAKQNPTTFTCCTQGLKIGDVYNGGVTFVAFLAAQFGEAVHATLLRSGADSFDKALAEVTRPYTLDEVFARFRAWLAASGG